MIIVKQLPIIEEQLRSIKTQIEEKTKTAVSLVCTEDNYKEIKKIKAELNKDFDELERKRKEVKNTVMAPYNDFEKVYKECVTEVYKPSIDKLTNHINEVEEGLKKKKKAEVEEYFNEYLKSKDIDFIDFGQSNIKITLSDSTKKLKEQAKAFIEHICDDLKLIDTYEHKEEILVEYKKTLNVSFAITSVSERHAAVLKEKERITQNQLKHKDDVIRKVDDVLMPPEVCEVTEEQEDNKIYPLKFTVYGTKKQLKKIKEFIEKEGLRYE